MCVAHLRCYRCVIRWRCAWPFSGDADRNAFRIGDAGADRQFRLFAQRDFFRDRNVIRAPRTFDQILTDNIGRLILSCRC